MNARMTMKRSGFPMLPMTDLLWLGLMTMPAAVAAGLLITFVISRWTEITTSAMEVMGGLGLWYVAILSGWSAFTHIPLFVTGGKTRRYAWTSWLVGMVGMSVLSAVLVGIAYAVERAMYGALGWTPGFSDSHRFDSGYQVHLVVWEYLLAFLVMGAIGGFVGISVYRSRDFGWGAIIPAAILGALAGALERGNVRILGFISQSTFGVENLAEPVQLLLTLAIIVTAVWMAYGVAREVPVRNR